MTDWSRRHPIRRTSLLPLWALAVMGCGIFPVAQAADGHAARPAAVKPADAAPREAHLSVDELRDKLAARMAEVRPKAETGAHSPAGAPSTSGHAAKPRARPAHRPEPRLAKAAVVDVHAEPAKDHGGAHQPHWTYSGEGSPAAWGALKPEFLMCGIGSRQSPIDIRGGLRVDLAPIEFDYKPSGFTVVDNGHTVQANVGYGNAIQVNGRRYELVQFHFHRPSEERVNGRAFDMVIHMVHKDLEGRLAVVAVLLEQGSAHPIIQQVWNSLPLEKQEELQAPAPADLTNLLPADRRYFTYMGSLTTPPCTEGVLWLVMKQPVQVSPEQIGIFARLYPMNARPVQPMAGRMIKESN